MREGKDLRPLQDESIRLEAVLTVPDPEVGENGVLILDGSS